MATQSAEPRQVIVGRGVKLDLMPEIQVNLSLTLPDSTVATEIEKQLLELLEGVEKSLTFPFGLRNITRQPNRTISAQLFTFLPDDAKFLAQRVADSVVAKFGLLTTKITVTSASDTIYEVAA
jgi:hypothetical protein